MDAKIGLECPECGDAGPKDDNGMRGMDLSFCCEACGAHFDRVCTCGMAFGDDVTRRDRCEHCAYLTAPRTLSSVAVAARVERLHAELYPTGCRTKWAEMCEACCQRLGAQLPSAVVPGAMGAREG